MPKRIGANSHAGNVAGGGGEFKKMQSVIDICY
jgi:hypothetical protein